MVSYCEFFQVGRCQFGSGCKFLHENYDDSQQLHPSPPALYPQQQQQQQQQPHHQLFVPQAQAQASAKHYIVDPQQEQALYFFKQQQIEQQLLNQQFRAQLSSQQRQNHVTTYPAALSWNQKTAPAPAPAPPPAPPPAPASITFNHGPDTDAGEGVPTVRSAPLPHTNWIKPPPTVTAQADISELEDTISDAAMIAAYVASLSVADDEVQQQPMAKAKAKAKNQPKPMPKPRPKPKPQPQPQPQPNRDRSFSNLSNLSTTSSIKSGPSCPLCIEAFDSTELLFFPCSCGFQICTFCWNKIKEEGEGRCPSCRTIYGEPYIEADANDNDLTGEAHPKERPMTKTERWHKANEAARAKADALNDALSITKLPPSYTEGDILALFKPWTGGGEGGGGGGGGVTVVGVRHTGTRDVRPSAKRSVLVTFKEDDAVR